MLRRENFMPRFTSIYRARTLKPIPLSLVHVVTAVSLPSVGWTLPTQFCPDITVLVDWE